ncbi:LamG-like jellyroll fold domain-containing protein [Stenotrophomonas chelatiphaga]|uniref:LamG-like jellyroll fold domain-containing protein n=1 Tax=Stenotrophomonas chelatiphaga TaxID=517011 RepID=UPI00289BB7E8|nr:LamG-like jellyroll fold domain-containing protein [Stenotrophomonas chelatiphaga]
MQSIVTMIAGIPAAPGAPVVPASNIKPLYPGRPESAAIAHWLLGGNTASLADLKTQRSLVPAGAMPSFESNVAVIPNGINGLKTGVADAAAYTLAVVFRLDSEVGGNGRVIGGPSGASTLDNKGVLISQPAANTVNITPRAHASGIALTAEQLAPALGNYVFLAVAVAAQSVTTFVGGVGRATRTLPSAIGLSDRQIAVGNAYYTGGTYTAGMRLAEAIVFGETLTPAQVDALYQRSKQRAAERGITVY